MATKPPATRSKRARPQDVEDNVAPEPAPSAPVPAPAVKKRRLATAASASTSASHGETTESRRQNRSAARAGSSGDKPPKTSDGNINTNPRPPAVKRPRAPPKASRTQPNTQNQQNVYDVPDSGDELERPAFVNQNPSRNGQKSNETKQGNGATKPVAASKKLSGRGRKMAPAEDQETSATELETDNQVRPAVKLFKRGRPSKEGASAGRPLPPKGILTPRHKKAGRPPKSVAFDNSQRDKPTEEVFFEDLPLAAKTPRAEQPKKTVRKSSADTAPAKTVEEESTEEEADEDTKKEQQGGESEKGSNGNNDDDDDDDDEDDDEVCIICSKPDYTRSNQIVFCENCDKGFHQKCYKIPVIPEDEWFCRDCLQENALPETLSPSATEKPTPKAERPDIPNFEQHLQVMQRVLVDRCCGNRRLKLQGLDEVYDKTFQLIEQTVLAGEGNSMMVIGARGCGKTTLVETIVSELAVDNKDAFHVIRLNGFIHVDDKLALKEIWRQLGKDMNLEDDLVNRTSNYADTLASLLALLSHPSEITGQDEGVASKSVVFVIDEFDLFATHARQTLLYNLFDIAQARKAPIAVLGLTTRIDVVESLEKRVKSRFSHRYVHLSLPKSLPAYWDICRQGLSVDEEDMEAEGFDTSVEGLDAFRAYWEEKIETLSKTRGFQDVLEYHFYTSKSVACFLSQCILPLSALSASYLDLDLLGSSTTHASLAAPDARLHILAALSDLELALLIAAARLDIVAHTDTVNFAMAYDEYSSQMGKQRIQSAGSGMLALGAGGRLWGRGVAGMAWERLATLGLLIPAGIGGRSNAARGGLEGKMFKLDMSLEEVPAAVELPGFLAKWCSQI